VKKIKSGVERKKAAVTLGRKFIPAFRVKIFVIHNSFQPLLSKGNPNSGMPQKDLASR
jgi:hypothetical protein